MLQFIIILLLAIPWALICWGCVVLFGKHKTWAFRKWALLLSFLLTPLIGVPFANATIFKNGL